MRLINEIKPTPDMVLEWIRDYQRNRLTLIKLEKDYQNAIRGGGATAQYGEESVMPKAIGGNGDPVYREVNIILNYETGVINNIDYKIKYIENRMHRIKKERHGIVFSLRSRGYTSQMIAERLGISRTGVQNILRDISEVLIGEDNK
ncbi:hypothetical protein J4760_04125 [Salinicoccus sp. ID82-1]|uniref:hypothetical protein n=1 Tax=Salinicoccus sp. ID82-1 TaxID=2820269 RepID=UPI001F3D8508|nr:hypothetical protein [Salinicoccus sp. ID82-1]MCG1009239.1 hypothetical protein [Salinicoccus sp. ID82-1]